MLIRVRVLVPAFALVTLSGCMTSAGRDKLVRQRAAFDLQCDENKLTVRDLGASSVGVSGCGSRAAYALDTCSPGDKLGYCKIKLNSPVQKEPVAQ